MSEFNNEEVYGFEEEEVDSLTEIFVEDDEILHIDENDEEDDNEDIDIEDESNINATNQDLSYDSFQNHTDSVYCVAIHPTNPGVVITGGGDDTAYIWNYKRNNIDSNNTEIINNENKQNSIKLEGHTDTVTSVGFNFNGNLALTGGYDGLIKIWNVNTGELVQTLEGPEDIEWAQWHMKGNAVIAGSRDGTIWMWLAHNGQCVHVFAGHDGAVTCGGFTKDGKMIYTGGEDGTVRQWNPKTGTCRHIFNGGYGHQAEVTCMASGGDGDLLLSGSADGTIKLYQLSGKKVLKQFIHSTPSSINLENTSTTNTKMMPITEEDDEEDEAGGNTNNTDDNGDNNSTDGFIMNEAISTLSVECVGFAKSDTEWKWMIASGGADKTLKVWDTMSGSLRCTCIHNGSVVALQWHRILPIICTSSLDCDVRLWDARSGALLKLFTGHQDFVTSIDMAATTTTVSESTTTTGGGGDMTTSIGGEGKEENMIMTDVIISVSDDKTAKVFIYDFHQLI